MPNPVMLMIIEAGDVVVPVDSTHPLPTSLAALGDKTATEILDEATIAAGATTVLADCSSIDLSTGKITLVLTVEATYNAAAVLGIRIHVRTSYDNTNWDTENWDTWDANFAAGATIRQSEDYCTSPMYIKVLVENLDPAQAVTNVKVISTLG